MKRLPLATSLQIISQGSRNWSAGRPIVVSFEVTDSCTCWCRHCDHGGPRDRSRDLHPADYRRYMEALQPAVVQVSGGEPLMRPDIVEVVRAIKGGRRIPYTILVSNWSEMTEEKYLALREAGINQFSVSLDFPDARHDDFRRLDGLYGHLESLIPRLATLGHDDIVLNTCITSWNVDQVNLAADKASEWGVNVSFSAYSPRRIGDRQYFLNTPEQLARLRLELEGIEGRMAGKKKWIANSCTTLHATQQYFETGGMPNCKAGLRFLVVTSDGALQPCSMQFTRYALEDRQRMVDEFTATNTCDECYVSIRSYLDKPFLQLLRENVGAFLGV
ncbi:MAG TPA: radical SAM protein [Vicinamibacterales bacterium]|nr:radical SAM protein [Vicinamibacterales bacterium]